MTNFILFSTEPDCLLSALPDGRLFFDDNGRLCKKHSWFPQNGAADPAGRFYVTTEAEADGSALRDCPVSLRADGTVTPAVGCVGSPVP